MPNSNPNLGSFLNSSQFTSQIPSGNPLYAAMLAGSTFALPEFSGSDGAAEKDPGGLFGWLIYARNFKSNPVIGTTSDRFIVYSTPADLISDLNKLSGVTHCLISYTGSGGTHGFFAQTSTTDIETRKPLGNDFLHALHYLAYGGQLIVAGSTIGLDHYETKTANKIEVLIGVTTNASIAQWIENKPYTIGVFPSGNGDGKGTTAANFATLFSSATLVTGTTVADRIFNIYGAVGVTYDVSTLQTGAQLTYDIPAISEVAGAIHNSKQLGQIFLSIAGVDRSIVLNGNITNSVDWASSLKSTLRQNRVNFYVNYNPVFLGSDLVGATASTNAISISERIGPAFLKKVLTKEINDIVTRYLFELNDSSTRSTVTAEVQQILDEYNYALNPSGTQIICDSTNNIDYSSTLTVDVIIKPILSIDSFVINVSLSS